MKRLSLFACALVLAACSSSKSSEEADETEGALEEGEKMVCTPVELAEATVDHRGEVFEVQKITFTMKSDETVQLRVDRKGANGEEMRAITETTPSFAHTERTVRASAKRDVMLKAGKTNSSDPRYIGFVTVHDHTFAVECEMTRARPVRCLDGSSRDDVDGCNSCTCHNGSWACTELFCPPPARPPGQGSACREGQSRPAGDGCNTCSCLNGQFILCTELACPPGRPPNAGSCPVDDTRLLDNCNTCTCRDGRWACTEMFCGNR